MSGNLYLFTPDASKRLIGRGIVSDAAVRRALTSHTLVIVAGSTNACAAAELLGPEFPAADFIRGYLGEREGLGAFPGDVVLRSGKWERGKQIFDVAADLGPGDVILKGANALHYPTAEAAVLVADSRGGTVLCAVEAAIGRRVELIVPVGLEKLVYEDLRVVSRRVNAPGRQGLRLLPVPGRVFTEIEALATLAGVDARLVAAGGIGEAAGAVLLLVEGPAEALEMARECIVAAGGRPSG
jgi:hypothetical protein